MKTRQINHRLLWLGVGLGLLLVLGSAAGHALEGLPGVYLPLVLKDAPPIPFEVTGAWTTDAQDVPDSDFIAGETIKFFGSGLSTATIPIEVTLSWYVDGACGKLLLNRATVTVEPGSFSALHTQLAPACSGEQEYTFQLTYRGSPREVSTPLTITNQVAVEVRTVPAFDKCDNPSVSQMAEWWAESPYWAANIYIGGIHRGCDNLDLTPEWVTAVLAQGWTLIPTWVGPQAPCSPYFSHLISYDPVEAYQQGLAEADDASAAAAGLGLTSYGAGSTIIYYDMEGYPGSTDPECRAAVSAFVNGWTERMHALGNTAAMYGGACSSYINDWARIPNVPDDVWIAAWYADEYDPEANVWDVPCVSSDYWVDQQRLRQYAGDIKETWGDVTMAIDADVTDGELLVWAPDGAALAASRAEPIEWQRGPSVTGLGALSAEQAWALVDGHLFWTADGGASWLESGPASGGFQAAVLLDAGNAWLVSQPSPTEPAFTIWRSMDGGESWQTTGRIPLDDRLVGARVVALDFINAQQGWLALRLASSANFNLGALFHTTDGGLTWEERSLPGGGTIDFLDAQQGWTLAGPEGDQLYRTQDGGITWQPASTGAQSPLRMADSLLGSLPGAVEISYVDPLTGWAITRTGNCSGQGCVTSSAIWRTLDGGATWGQVTLPAAP